LLLFFEYDFTVVYKPSRTHAIVDSLSKLPNITKPTYVSNQITHASLFYIELEWLNDVKDFLKTRKIGGTLSIHQKYKLVRKVEHFTLKNGELYKIGQDNRL
jgi:hypothetical protein